MERVMSGDLVTVEPSLAGWEARSVICTMRYSNISLIMQLTENLHGSKLGR